jgi:hypothetical protein
MEVSCNICSTGEFITRSEASVVGVLPSERVCKVRGISGGGLGTPVSAPVAATITMAGPDVIASTTHVVDDSISIDSDASSSASLDHVTKLLS